MATTTNYGWETADDTDLVKDGALAIRTLGSAIDTTTKALNPSTTLGDIEYRSATANTNTRLAIGSTGNVLTVAGGVPTWAAPVSVLGVFSINETQANTTQGGTFTAGAWRTRTLNTSIQNTISGASLASNQFTLPAGTYSLTAFAPAYKVGGNNARIYNITDSAVVVIGNNGISGSGDATTTIATLAITFTIAATKTFELQHYSGSTFATQGFGGANGNGYDEIYSSVTIVKVA
jgi:hypothetical protein